ncbi:MAG: tyrosine-type recombinase/integrase [Arenimonas sp.]
MATLYRHGNRWRAQVCIRGVRDSVVLPTRQQAAQWALQREGELSGRKLPDKTLGDALAEYGRKVTPLHKGAKWEQTRLLAMEREAIAKHKLAGLTDDDFIDWRDHRLTQVKPGTVAREMNLLRSVLEHARREWKWIRVNPIKGVKPPPTPAGRRRRVTADEVTAIRLAFGIGKDYQGKNATQRVGMAFLFALETAMRSGEIVGMDWRDVSLARRFVVLAATKNGDRREVPLSSAACAILRALPSNDGPVFELDGPLRDALWRKNRPASLKDLHFHDSRGEAVWRLSKKLDLLQLAQVIGHRDLRSLQHYYRATAEELAMQLG